MHRATFILSTGRCGTQWLHHLFHSHYAECIHSCHEPLGYEQYLPFRRVTNYLAEKNSLGRALRKHIDSILENIETKDYIETGSPCWSVLPQLNALIPGGIQVIWITRHPSDLIESLLSHGLYRQPILPHQTIREPITPDMNLARYPEFQSHWMSMRRQEKLLYYWLEVNAMGDQLEASGVPMLKLKFESLFKAKSIKRLIDFLDLKFVSESLDFSGSKVDNYNYGKFESVDDLLLDSNPSAQTMMDRIGYKNIAYA